MVAVGAVLCAVASVGLILAFGELITHSLSGRPGAKRRAGELLRAVLTPDQYGHLMQRGHIDIASPSNPERTYRVPKGSGRVQVREKGKLTMWLCQQQHARVQGA